MEKIQKIIVFPKKIIQWVKLKNLNAKTPEYSRRAWAWKCSHILVGAYAIDFLGAKLAFIDREIIQGRLLVHGPDYLFYIACQGLILGLTFWRLLEISWSARDKLKCSVKYDA